MAEDKKKDPMAAVVAADAEKNPNKPRAPQQQKAVAKSVTGTSDGKKTTSAKTTGPAKSQKSKPVVSKTGVASKSKPVARHPKTETPIKPVISPLGTQTLAADEMADILQLEAENRRLRILLAEKLREENADLRKRIAEI